MLKTMHKTHSVLLINFSKAEVISWTPKLKRASIQKSKRVALKDLIDMQLLKIHSTVLYSCVCMCVHVCVLFLSSRI